jgi:hypothetical protein
MHLAVRREVERDRGEREDEDQREQRDSESTAPAAKATPGVALLYDRRYLRTLGAQLRRGMSARTPVGRPSGDRRSE